MSTKRQLMQASLKKHQRIRELLLAVCNLKLGYDSCGYCKMHNVTMGRIAGCSNCTLNTYNLCETGSGFAYQSLADLRTHPALEDAIEGAEAFIEQIRQDIEALPKPRKAVKRCNKT